MYHTRSALITTIALIGLTACSSSAVTTTVERANAPTIEATLEVPRTTADTESTENTLMSSQPGAGERSADQTLARIQSLAESNDLDGLASLALGGEAPFTASLGQGYTEPGDLVDYWQTVSDPAVPEIILGLLEAGSYSAVTESSSGEQIGMLIFPAAFGDNATAADRETLESIFGVETVESSYFEDQYIGWRLGVDEAGVWRFLLAGD